ncbi:MAG: tetratricopeptide repeat protein [Candidatus Omnitrophica bacterium]|nr:tetratricopeptide repeat protein [Candidatus Omnitrophota bacterium]
MSSKHERPVVGNIGKKVVKDISKMGMPSRVHAVIAFIIITAAIFIAYSGALKAGFIYDDDHLIAHNALIKNLSNFPAYFRTDLFSDKVGEFVSNSYRPAQTITNALDYMLYALEPYGYHLTNILLHIFNAMLVFFFFRHISDSDTLSLSASLLYSIHPINTQSIAYISGRGDILMSIGAMLSLIYFAKYKGGSYGFLVLSVFFYLFSMLSREASIVVVPALLAGYALYFRKKEPAAFRVLLIYPVTAMIYLAVRNLVLKAHIAAIGLEYIPLFQRALTSIKGLFISLRIMILPYDLHFDRFVPVERSLLAFSAIVPILGLSLMIWAVVHLYKKGLDGRHQTEKIVSFGLFWYMVSMVPYLNIVPLQVFVSENWLYEPSLGIIFAFIAVTGYYYGSGRAGRANLLNVFILLLFLASLIAYGAVTVKRTADYTDPTKLYLKNLSYEPNVKFYYMLGTEYGLKGRYDLAISAFKDAIEIDKTLPNLFVFNARFNLGVTYAKLGRIEDAIKEFNFLLDLKNVPGEVNGQWNRKAASAIKEIG